MEELLEPTQLNEDNLREQLNVLVSSGRTREMVGKDLTHEEVKKITEAEVKKYYKRYEAALANKTTDAVAQSAMGLASKLLGFALPIDDISALQRDLQEDYLISQELKITCGWLSLKCGKLMALAAGVLHVAKHIDLKELTTSWSDFKNKKLELNQELDQLNISP